MEAFKNLSVGRKGLQYKLLIAFSLMSIVPLLILTYLITKYIFPNSPDSIMQVTAIVLFTLWVAWTGFMLAKQLILPVIELAFETKVIASGQYDSRVPAQEEGELGDIASAVNTMTGRIRGYIGQLQEYSKKTAALNVSIHRKVLTLTNLMKLGDMISSGATFKEVADFSVEKLAQELYGGFCVIFTKGENGKYSQEAIYDDSDREINIASIASEIPSLEKLFIKDDNLFIDSRSFVKHWQNQIKDSLGEMNVLLFPMKVAGEVVGVILLGSFTEDFEFEEEDIDSLRAFEKEVVLGYQSAQAFKRVESIDVVDTLTGLYSFSYLEDRLEDEINRSVYYQRPCSLIVIDVDDFDQYSSTHGKRKGEEVLKKVGELLSDTVSPVGKIARAEGAEFGILTPENNKRESLAMAEDIRKKIEEMRLSAEAEDRVTVSIGVSENPIDGVNAKEIMARAREYVEKAKTEGKNKVIGE